MCCFSCWFGGRSRLCCASLLVMLLLLLVVVVVFLVVKVKLVVLDWRGSGPARFVQFAAAVGTSATSATRWCCCCGGGGFRVMMILIVFVCLWWILLRLLLLRRLFCVSFIATSDRWARSAADYSPCGSARARRAAESGPTVCADGGSRRPCFPAATRPRSDPAGPAGPYLASSKIYNQ